MAEKIAIIGGGMGGLSAAYALTRKDIDEKYDITIFQMGWRLGGKCATGRGPFDRIEEHGIHGFLGAYYNALALMKGVYGDERWERPPDHPLKTFDEAFVKIDTGLYWERHAGVLKRWLKWTPTSPFTLKYIQTHPQLLLLWIGVYAKVLKGRLASYPSIDPKALFVIPQFIHITERLDDLFEVIEKISAEDDFELRQHDSKEDTSDLSNAFWEAINGLIDISIKHSTSNNDDIRRNLLEIEMFQVILRGVRDDRLIFKGFGTVDGENYDAWMKRHGASINLIESPIVSHIINLTFQFPQGDISLPPRMSAASYLQWALRSGTFVEKSLYLFAAGTGETIVTPLYEVLKARGVKFKFFHELTDIKTNIDGTSVTSLMFQEQAIMKDGADYNPVKDVKGLASWPNAPFFYQIKNGAAMEAVDFEAPNTATFGKKLQLNIGGKTGSDFDKVILAIPPAATQLSAPSLIASNKEWRRKLSQMPTTATQAMQIWFNKPIETLANMPVILQNGLPERHYYGSANFPSEMHGELDFSKYIKFENWDESAPQGLLYGCGVMVDPPPTAGITLRESARIRAVETSRTMLTTVGVDLLPLSVDQTNDSNNPQSLDFSDVFVHASSPHVNAKGQARLVEQYFRGNVYPADRYTQSPPYTKSMRINPLHPGLSNMTGAGDWVDTVLNVGSVECAVMGGLLAAAFVHNPKDALKITGAWVTVADSLLRPPS